ncbi:SEC23-interacting protein isoform X2 [Solea senegalensis]|uniref:SEC23-interacting protein isoform X2 n=2 Tax=Solea senegalensis TaxID=28829 RepID=A0AAV6S2B9_SOLSE|nr:SEC23-interacting protein [Solea senegalensis]KAG7511581.1 SEC23-interacting protein isoform X2 [Solea senegalensis]
MADRKNNNNVANPGANLLFSAAPEFNFNLPFMPVSQATGPAVLSGDDSTDVGEEDSFLGQTSGNGSAPSTFNYFSSPVASSDPFASIGQSPYPSPALSAAPPTTTGPVSVPSSVGMVPPPPGPHMNPATPTAFGNVVYQSPMGRHTPPPTTMTPPPPQMQPQSYNPYRHTPTSSRVNPYIPAPEVLPPTHTPQQHNSYPFSSPQQTFPPSGPTFTKPPPTQIQAPPPTATSAGAIVPAGPMMPYNYNIYEPVQPHWFYCKQVESKSVWLPFSIIDSLKLEETFNSVQPDPENVIVRTEGGRYDVQLYDRNRTSVYWEEEPTEVRRCTWFYKGDTDSRFIPYSEEFSEKLEVEYKKAVSTNQWHRRLEFPSGETIVMHNPKVIVQFQPSSIPDEWGTTQDGQTRPRVVKRGLDDDHDEVPDGELSKVDHLVFMVHGIGPVCDLRFRSMVECVDDFRSVSLKLLHSHFKKPMDEHAISRVEFLPVQWYAALHGDATGVDRRIKKITLPSTGRLRHFTNETLLDVLFYNSPTYCQTIMDTVALEINRLYALFMKRNPDFRGGISVAGHSLGSLILFDLLSNQKDESFAMATSDEHTSNGETNQVAAPVPLENNAVAPPAVEEEAKDAEELEDLSTMLENLGLSEYKSTFDEEKIDNESFLMCTIEDLKEMGIPLGPRKKIAKFVKERVNKQAARQAAQEKKPEIKETSQVTAPPPPAEPLPGPVVKKLPVGNTVSSIHVDYNYFEVGTGQVSVVYHSLDFEPVNFFALGSPIGMFLTVRGVEKIEETYQLPTCKGFFNIYHPLDPVAYRIEPMIMPEVELKPVLIPHHKGRKRLHLELKESLSRMGSDLKHGFISSLRTAWQTINEFARAHTSSDQLQAQLAIVANQIEEEEKQAEEEHKIPEIPEPPKEEEPQVKIGMLNGGNRIDYVLQEKPIESFNEYLFALQSHLCYWQSEDTALLILKELYKDMGIHPEQLAH